MGASRESIVVAKARDAGFATAAPVAFTPCEMASAGGELQTAMAVSWPAAGFGLDVTAGRAPARLDESVIDEAVATSMGIGVGSGLLLKRGSQVRDTVVVGTVVAMVVAGVPDLDLPTSG